MSEVVQNVTAKVTECVTMPQEKSRQRHRCVEIFTQKLSPPSSALSAPGFRGVGGVCQSHSVCLDDSGPLCCVLLIERVTVPRPHPSPHPPDVGLQRSSLWCPPCDPPPPPPDPLCRIPVTRVDFFRSR